MQKSTAVQGINLSKIVFLLSLITFVYWLLGNSIAIYKYAVVGALFEILWLPMETWGLGVQTFLWPCTLVGNSPA